jgi:hypothetical protein
MSSHFFLSVMEYDHSSDRKQGMQSECCAFLRCLDKLTLCLSQNKSRVFSTVDIYNDAVPETLNLPVKFTFLLRVDR